MSEERTTIPSVDPERSGSEDPTEPEESDEGVTLFDLVAQLGSVIGFSFDPANRSPEAAEEYLNADGAWEYRFEINEAPSISLDYGFIAAPSKEVETSFGDWGSITVEPYNVCLFINDYLVGQLSPEGGVVGGFGDFEELGGTENLEQHYASMLVTELEVQKCKNAEHAERENKNE